MSGPRLSLRRIGMLLAVESGVPRKLLPMVRIRLGGAVGWARQWTSRIHADDLVELIQVAA